MKQPFHLYEEITFQQFALFIKTHSKQFKTNINIYLNLDDDISEPDRKIIGSMLHSFFQLLTSPANTTGINENHYSFLDTWLQSQVSIINKKSLYLFQLIFEKSLLTLMIQIKYNRIIPIFMFLLSIFTYLVHSYSKWEQEEGQAIDTQSHLPEHLRRLQKLDKLNQLLIRSSGVKDLAFILKKCEEYFQYKRCVFYAYIPWSNQFYGVIGAELAKVQSMKGQITEDRTVFNSKTPIYLKDPRNFVKEEHIKLFNLSSIIFVPIIHHEQLFGWLTFDQVGEEFDCSKNELTLLEQVGKRIGMYLSRKGEEKLKTSDIHLTERELTILDLLSEGYDNKKIGESLFLSEHTVRDYVSSLMTKLESKNRTQVVASAFRLGLIN
ncbi:LuxR C-terminal-related transcriptional regulator [Bacillus salipaludis]|uniref:LuxR C-terminal-related transcriptional regulator n=1 Tax=Bacillus salipaludis TaxID=2547811 RepID=A0AA90TX08_9BACI|nr:LuxR C-terminal-related transcriptional regulator [Bacillus salipaludis]MDQ6600882.1 LuxR C-terminal-related transcriptional regulator [Bacillus salipaludis]